MRTILVLVLLANLAPAPATETPAPVLISFTLPGVVSGQDLTIHAWCRAGVCGEGWATVGPDHLATRFALTGDAAVLGLPSAGLTFVNDRLAGTCLVGLGGDGVRGQRGMTWRRYRCDGRVTGVTLAGSFAGDLVPQVEGRSLPGGSFTGLVEDETALRQRLSPIATGRDYPCWRGSTGAGTASDCGTPLVTSQSEARLLWRGEAHVPAGYYEGPGGDTAVETFGKLQAGFSSPVVGGGRVVVGFYEGSAHPDPRASIHPEGDKWKTLPESIMIKRYGTVTDDVVVCLDAQTGALVWRRNLVGKGRNFTLEDVRALTGNGSKKGVAQTPVIAGDAVYVLGSGGWAFALDLATGATRWEVQLFQLDPNPNKRPDGTSSPVFAAGVFACPVGSRLVGLDAATGAIRWKAPGVPARTSPLTWTHRGRQFIITNGQAIDPATGSALWSFTGDYGKAAVSEDHLVLGGSEKSGMQGWRISPEKAERIWTSDLHSVVSPMIRNGRVITRVPPVPATSTDTSLAILDLATGAILARSPNFRSDAHGSLIGSDDVAFYEGVCLRTDQTGRLDLHLNGWAQIGQGYANSTTPALADGRIFLRSFDGVLCYDVRRRAGP